MAALGAEDGDLVLGLSPWEKLGALHGDVRVPLGAVEELSVSRQPFGDLRGIRAPEPPSPGASRSARRHRAGKDFVALYRGKPTVIVGLRDVAFRRLVVSADDPAALVASPLVASLSRC